MKPNFSIFILLLAGNSLANPIKHVIPKPAQDLQDGEQGSTFYLYHNETKLAGVRPNITAFNTEFYFNEPGSGYCPSRAACAPPNLNAGYVVFHYFPPSNGNPSLLGLNSTIAKTKGQEVYIHPSGSLRFLVPEEGFIFDGEFVAGWSIIKGHNGAPDLLHIKTGSFYACPLHNPPDHGWQIFVGIPTFRQTGCVTFTPYIRYTTKGTYEWT